VNGVWLPEGILIPWYADGHIWKLHIRRLSGLKDGNAKYVQVKGSREGLYNVDTIRVDIPLVVCEGEFDALAGQQLCSDVASWVATGATTRARRDRWLARMGMASFVLVAYDDDVSDKNGKRAGEEGALYWERMLPHAMCWPPWRHDLNEMVQQGHDLRTWIELGVTVAATADTAEAAPGYRVHQRDQDIGLPGEIGSDDQQTFPSADIVLLEDVHETYARLQRVNRVQTPFGPGVIYPYTPLVIQIQRGRIGVLLDKPVHASGRRLEYFFLHEVSSAIASQ